MDNKVQNQKQDILPDENSFNDEDILQDTMTSLKHLATQYGTLAQEASNKQFLTKVETLAKEVSTMARDSFNLMFEKGWYSLEKQTPEKINQEHQKFASKKPSLG